MGDDVQSLKAGVMEVAEIFVVNKSDLPGAERVEAEILGMQELGTSISGERGGWVAPVVRTVAAAGDGVDRLMGEIARFLAESGDQLEDGV